MMTRKSQSSPFSPEIGDILKRVDALVKNQDIDGAKREILRAKVIEPKNMYVHAYSERIELLIEEQKRNKEAEEALRRKEEDERRMAEEQRKRRLEESVMRKLDAEARHRLKKTAPPQAKRDHAEEIEEYVQGLFAEWKNGVPDKAGSSRLASLRARLNITPAEHTSLEASAKRESYMQVFKNLWTTAGNDDGPSTLTALRQRYGVKAGEYDGLEFTIIQELRKPRNGPHLLVIDDDTAFLKAVTGMLREEGFDVQGFTTSDEAYAYLLQHTPDLILADINLETSTMGGFAFYEKLQETPRLAALPFIFVSGLTDDVILRAGKELGADDYVTKPFVNETLVSVIKGKLRRYTEMGVLNVN
ncbi:MAG: hypothetical protein HBSIN02_22450 [Bacteroidia bacterium]|nr:MAG: hypothetical protein HBSIN02_22450 [Bacteroidia bacterium]